MTTQIEHHEPSYLAIGQPLARFGHAIWAITLRELRVQYGKRRLGVFWALVEPLAYIVGLTFIMSFVHDRSPLGGHLAPFVATGLMPYMLINATESSVRTAIRPNQALLVFPRVRPIDLFLGRWIIETSTLLLVTVILFGALVTARMVEPPSELYRILPPLGLAMTAGLALGIVNAAIISVFKPWSSVWQVIARINFLTSGVFFTAHSFPPAVIEMLQYQPTLHITEWVRSGYYSNFESGFHDPLFPAMIVLALVLAALVLERVCRVQMAAK